ncbi:MAG: hypothetical protein AAFR31_01440 [Cyanobacteria bacterium J06627_8]
MEKWLKINVALKCWLVFLIVFVFAGYPVEVAIALGVLGGLGGGFISAWWNAKGSQDVAQPDAERVFVLMQRVRRQIEGQLGLADDKQEGQARDLKMGFFRVRDPNRGARRRYRGLQNQNVNDDESDESNSEDDSF